VLRALRIATVVAALLALLGFVDLLLPALTRDIVPLLPPEPYRMGFRCLVSIFFQEGYSGWFFAAMACLPAAGYFVMRRPADLVLTVFLIVTSLFSYRRKPVLGLAFALGILLISQAHFKPRMRIIAVTALTAAVAIPILGGPLIDIFAESYLTYIAPP